MIFQVMKKYICIAGSQCYYRNFLESWNLTSFHNVSSPTMNAKECCMRCLQMQNCIGVQLQQQTCYFLAGRFMTFQERNNNSDRVKCESMS